MGCIQFRPPVPRGMWLVPAVALVALATLMPGRATAVPFDNQPKILLHLKALTTKNACTTWGDLSDCQQANTKGLVGTASGPFYYMYVLVATGPYRSSALGGNNLGVAAAQFGLDFDATAGSGVDVFTWSLCATLEFTSTGWPEDGGGNLMTWDSTNKCQKGEVAIAGYFYCGAYSADTFKLVARPVDGAAKIADCNSQEIALNPAQDLGTAVFSPGGVTQGFNPCGSGVPPPPPQGAALRVSYDAPGGCLPALEVPTPITVTATQGTSTQALHAYSLDVSLRPGYTLAPEGIVEGTYLSGVGNTFFQVTDRGAGSYTVDCSILGLPCGATLPAGTLFMVNTIRHTSAVTEPLSLAVRTMRDCQNHTLLSETATPAGIDLTPPLAIADLSATTRSTGNDSDGTGAILVTFTPPSSAATLEVYRAPFGHYPGYDDLGGQPPATPATYPPDSTWVLTDLTASGQIDEPPTRDSWYYLAYCRDACGNLSPVSNQTEGTLNYQLGDFASLAATCDGDNLVNTSDVSFFGAHYGVGLAASDPIACMDIGPTIGGSLHGRPVTDGVLDFEDLVLLGINYGQVSAPGGSLRVRSTTTAGNTLSLETETARGPLEALVAVLRLSAHDRIQALSARVRFDPDVVRPTATEPGDLVTSLPFPSAFLVPAEGQVDFCGLGQGAGIAGDGDFARIRFARIGPGDPAIRLDEADARDGTNHPVALRRAAPIGETAAAPWLGAPFPNPMFQATRIPFHVDTAGPVGILLVDGQGRFVRRLLAMEMTAGLHEIGWDGRDDRGHSVASGAYFVRLTAGAKTVSAPVRLIRR